MHTRIKILLVLSGMALGGCVDGQNPVIVPICTEPDTVIIGESVPPQTACRPVSIRTTTKR